MTTNTNTHPKAQRSCDHSRVTDDDVAAMYDAFNENYDFVCAGRGFKAAGESLLARHTPSREALMNAIFHALSGTPQHKRITAITDAVIALLTGAQQKGES